MSNVIIADGHMDRAHLRLGHEGYQVLQKKRCREAGRAVLGLVHEHLPELSIITIERERGLLSHGGAGTAQYTFEIKLEVSKPRKFWFLNFSGIFSTLLLEVVTDDAEMGVCMIYVENCKVSSNKKFMSALKFVAKKSHWNVVCPQL